MCTRVGLDYDEIHEKENSNLKNNISIQDLCKKSQDLFDEMKFFTLNLENELFEL